MSYYRSRNRFSNMVLEKLENDKILVELDKSQWYRMANLDQLSFIKDKFVHLGEDDETKLFIDNCFEKSDWFFTQLFHSMVLTLFKWFMATTSINGLLQRGSMFVFSVQQFSQLIDFENTFGGSKLKNLLDLGAGDGLVTAKMAPFFENVYATEMSYTMQWRLGQKGFKVVDVFEWDKVINPDLSNVNTTNEQADSAKYLKYDVISCLNLLDRCDQPISMLKKMKNSLVPNGLLVVALVLPFRPFVEYNKDNRPTEKLFDNYCEMNKSKIGSSSIVTSQVTSSSASTEETASTSNTCEKVHKCQMSKLNCQITHLVENIFKPNGLELVKFTKLPYLCEGNLSQSYYYMIDYVFILKSV